jgi:hypothetical protein
MLNRGVVRTIYGLLTKPYTAARLPDDFDPEHFDLEEVNSALSLRRWNISPPSRKGCFRRPFIHNI